MATGNTTNYNLPYPVPTDPVDVAGDIQELSDSLDTFLTAPAFIGAVSASTISTGPAVFSGNTSTNLVRITQTGSGNALLVEDSTNPDSTPFVIDSDGDVGIGSASPDARLVVVESGSQTAVRITNTGTGNSFVVEDSANPDSTPFVINASGNVGIGTNSPNAVLSVSGGDLTLHSPTTALTTERSIARTDAGSTNPLSKIGLVGSGTNGFVGNIVFYAKTTDFFDGSLSEVMRIQSGNVGIGTSSPDRNLVIYGASNSRIRLDGDAITDIVVRRASTNANGPQFYLDKARGTIASPTVVASGDVVGQVFFRGHDGSGFQNAAVINVAIDGTPGAGDMPGRLEFYTTPNDSATATERMRITSSGNVGIGTTSPGAKLQLGNGTDSAYFLQSGSASFVGHSIRNVLDTTSGNSTSYIDAQNQNSVADSHLFFVHESDGGSTIIFGNTPAGSKLSDRRVERMRISSAGNVGIGTSSPGAILDVSSGNSQFPSALRIRSTTHATSRRAGIQIGDTSSPSWVIGVDAAGNGSNDFFLYDGSSGVASHRMQINSSGTVSFSGSTIIMESGTTGAPTDNVFFRVERGTSPDVDIRWNETSDAWQFTNNGSLYYDIPIAAGGGTGFEANFFLGGL